MPKNGSFKFFKLPNDEKLIPPMHLGA